MSMIRINEGWQGNENTFYWSFPNIYALRGTPTRDVTQWISPLDLMRNLKADYLISSHTKPIQEQD